MVSVMAVVPLVEVRLSVVLTPAGAPLTAR
jgi:hypothetical protein